MHVMLRMTVGPGVAACSDLPRGRYLRQPPPPGHPSAVRYGLAYSQSRTSFRGRNASRTGFGL